jgi:hypothetical protein
VKKAARCLVSALRYRVIQKKMQRNKQYHENGEEHLIIEDVSERTKHNALKKMLGRLAKFTEANAVVQKINGTDNAVDPIEEMGHELIEMNVKVEKMNDLVSACYNLLKS